MFKSKTDQLIVGSFLLKCSEQCDNIGPFLKVIFGDKISYQSNPNIWLLFVLFSKSISFETKTAVANWQPLKNWAFIIPSGHTGSEVNGRKRYLVCVRTWV